MFQEQKHKRLFEDIDVSATQIIIQTIQLEQIKVTQLQKQKYCFDFFEDRALQSTQFDWKIVQEDCSYQQCAKAQSSFVNYIDLDLPVNQITLGESSDYAQENEEGYDIAEEPEVNIPNGSEKIDKGEAQQQADQLRNSLQNRKTLAIYPELENLTNDQSDQQNKPINQSRTSLGQGYHCSVTQTLRLSCLSYLESASTMAEEDDFSLDEANMIKLIAQKKKKVFEEEESQAQEKLRFKIKQQEKIEPTQVFEVWPQNDVNIL